MSKAATTTNCLTIQNRVEYYCSLNTSKDASVLQGLLETPKNQANAESIHLLLRHPSVLRGDRTAFYGLMQVIGQLPHLRQAAISTLLSKKLPAPALAAMLKHANQLQRLTLEDITLQESPYELAGILQNHPTLHTVKLMRCSCSPVHVLLQALSRQPNLCELTLDGSILAQQQDADAMAALAAICKSNSLQSLHLTDIEENSMTQQLIAMIEALHQQPFPNNRKLLPHTMPISTSKNLRELSLNLSVRESMPLIVVRALGQMLLFNRSLQTLVVPWTGGGEIWLPIIEALVFNTTLQQIRLDPDSLLSATTRQQQQQQHHHHHQNMMDSSSSNATCSCLSHHFLQRAATILRERNTTLHYLWYDDDDWESIDLEIDLYLRSNRLGRRHLIYGDEDIIPTSNTSAATGCSIIGGVGVGVNGTTTATHEEWIKALVSSRGHAHVSYYWLSQNPSLLVASKSA